LDERLEFIEAWLKQELSFVDLCVRFGIAPKTGYKWLQRFKESGKAGLEDRSRAPHSHPQAKQQSVVEAAIEVREQHPTWGPRKIQERLQRQSPEDQPPAASSIGEWLRRRGLVVERRHRRKTPPQSEPLAHAGGPNAVWCADFKGHFQCGDGVRCDPLTATDAFSRYLLRCRAVDKADGPHVRAVFEAMFRECGLPDAIRTDNGPPFASTAPGGLSRLSMWWLRLGIRHERIEPGCPQQNGRHERMHRTLKAETANPPRANLRQQQLAFERFTEEYNCQRPHEALAYRTPAEVYTPSSRLYRPGKEQLIYPEGVAFRRISQQGSLKWKCERTFLSEVLAREVVGLLEIDDQLFEVYYGPKLLGWFDGTSHVFEAEKRPPRKHRAKPKT
jgi:transposase InsO family protein